MSVRNHKNKQLANRVLLWGILLVAVVLMTVLGAYNIDKPPLHALGGAIWLKNGVHYISDTEIATKVEQLNAPKEAAILEKVKSSTPACETLESGFCQKLPGEFVQKTIVSAPVAYVPAIPDRKEVIGYCTLCRDGSFSPSCAVGRGACSWHGGVSSYNVPRYRTIAGKPAIQARPAVYSYSTKEYKDSVLYFSPEIPSLASVVGY